MELTFLGTGAGVPAKERNVSASALKFLSNNGSIWLFDCGEATQHQILHTSLKPSKIEKIFITHLHGDHIFGLPGLLGSRSFQGGESVCTVYGPPGIKAFIETALKVSGTHLRYPLLIEEIDEGVVFENGQYLVKAAALDHGLPCFGYRIEEKEQPGELRVDLLKEMNIPSGPIYKEIKAGKKVTLKDGREIDGAKYIGPNKQGRVVTILGDTRFCHAAIALAENANVVVHEATFKESEGELAHKYFHSTTKEAATVAKEAGAQKLILTHISSRYQKGACDDLLQEARATFSNTELAKDLDKFNIGKI